MGETIDEELEVILGLFVEVSIGLVVENILDVELVLLVLGEVKSWLIDNVGTNTVDVDCVNKVELVG